MSIKTFGECKALFDDDHMDTLTASESGLLWLKIKSVSRKALLQRLVSFAKLPQREKKAAELFKAIYEDLAPKAKAAHALVDQFIRDQAPTYAPQELEKIASELHKMHAFSWGGDYSNALDRFLVDRYIKQLDSFDAITSCLQTEIPRAVEGYVLCSWYNHWSTILMEHIFRQHDKVLPAIGQVKKVDFFIDDIPFDLKTTYLPANYVDSRRKDAGLRGELAELRAAAKAHGIVFRTDGSPKDIAYEIAERIKLSGNAESRAWLDKIWAFRKMLLQECAKDPLPLIKNLYEQQGDMRFDSANRLFVVLADAADFENSWKLKRSPDLLKAHIYAYLDGFAKEKVRRVTFTHKSRSGTFSAVADVICIVANGDDS